MSLQPKCPATTKLRLQCKNNLKNGENLCYVHQRSTSETKTNKSTTSCQGVTKKGELCKNNSLTGSEYCRVHQCDTNIGTGESKLIPVIENIIAEYSDVNDYAKLIKYNPILYSWDKYFKNRLPSIYDAINIYDNLDLIKYILSKYKGNFNINYEEVNFKSVPTAKYIFKLYPLNTNHNNEFYESLIDDAIVSNNLELLKYLLSARPEHLDLEDLYYDFLKTALYEKDNLEIIKFLLNYARKHNSDDYDEIESSFIELAEVLGSKDVKKYIRTLESYDN